MIMFSLFLLGLIIGSFTNVIIDRLHTGLGLVKGRSRCFSCRKDLAWYDLIPVVSFFVLGGRCRLCGTRFGFRHVIVEISVACLFALTFFLFGISIESVLLLLSWPLLVAICVYDIRHLVIPNVLVFIFIGLSFISLFITNNSVVLPSVSDVLAGLVPFLFFWALWFFSHGRWMGFGDAKLVLGMGWFLGFLAALHVLVYAFWLGAIYSIAGILYTRIHSKSDDFGLKSMIPFGPFLICAFMLMVFVPFFVFVL